MSIRSPPKMSCRCYCRFNSFCVITNCSENHHRPLVERELLHKIMNETPEIANFKEDTDLKRKVQCAHGLRCFEATCGFKHGLNHEGRKILTKKFNKQWKAITMKDKIAKEIEEVKKSKDIPFEDKPIKWGDMV